MEDYTLVENSLNEDETALVIDPNIMRKRNVTAVTSYLYLFPNLKRLDLEDSQIGCGGMRCFVGCLETLPQLEILNLNGNSITTKGLEYLTDYFSDLPRLESLSLAKNSIDTKVLFKNVYDLPNLKKLDLSKNIVNLRCMKKYVQDLSQLQDIILEECHITSENFKYFVECFENLHELRYINLANNFIGNEIKYFSETIIEFRYLPNLESLILSHNNIRDGWIYFAKCVQYLNKLKYLELGWINSDKCFQALNNVKHFLPEQNKIEWFEDEFTPEKIREAKEIYAKKSVGKYTKPCKRNG